MPKHLPAGLIQLKPRNPKKSLLTARIVQVFEPNLRNTCRTQLCTAFPYTFEYGFQDGLSTAASPTRNSGIAPGSSSCLI